MRIKRNKKLKNTAKIFNLLGALLLVVGFMYGGVKTPAQAEAPDKVTICHAAGQEGTLQYVTLTIPYVAAFGPAGHFNEDGTTRAGHENDSMGPCQEDTATPTATNTPVDTATPTATNTPVDTATPTATNTPEETITPTATGTLEETLTPTATGTLEDTATPTATNTPEETITPTATATPKASGTPQETTVPEDMNEDEDPTTVATLSIPEVSAANVLIPVTGADLTGNKSVNTGRTIKNLGFTLLGVGMVLYGVSKKR